MKIENRIQVETKTYLQADPANQVWDPVITVDSLLTEVWRLQSPLVKKNTNVVHLQHRLPAWSIFNWINHFLPVLWLQTYLPHANRVTCSHACTIVTSRADTLHLLVCIDRHESPSLSYLPVYPLSTNCFIARRCVTLLSMYVRSWTSLVFCLSACITLLVTCYQSVSRSSLSFCLFYFVNCQLPLIYFSSSVSSIVFLLPFHRLSFLFLKSIFCFYPEKSFWMFCFPLVNLGLATVKRIVCVQNGVWPIFRILRMNCSFRGLIRGHPSLAPVHLHTGESPPASYFLREDFHAECIPPDDRFLSPCREC